MSTKYNRSYGGTKKTNKAQKQQHAVRIMAMFLAVLMILSCLSVLVYVFGQWNVAADSEYAYPNDLIAVGLECGAYEVAVGFEASTTNGFVVNKTTIEKTVRAAERIYTLSHNDVFVVNDATLSKVSGEYTEYTGGAAAIGGYHLTITEKLVDVNGVKVPQRLDIASEQELKALIPEIDAKLSGSGYSVIPSYIDDKYVLLIGDFSTPEAAEGAKQSLGAFTAEYNLGIRQPTTTGVSVIDPNLNKVLFEYDSGGFSQLGLSGNGGALLKTSDSRLYGGTLAYKRASGGVQVTSLIDFEEYVKCVVPWEIGASWNYNALTAFSIVVRTYALRKLNGRMSSYGIDLFDDSYDQVYGGYTRVNENVEKAVEETRGKVAFYNGTLAQLFYSSSTGGYTVSNSYVWGSSPIPYLETKATPWENYTDRSKGLWTVEVSASELAASLRETAACANLTSPIDSVTINSSAGESEYVTSITFTDTAGNTATVGNTTQKVKSALSDFVYSANFVVGKGSVERNYNIIKNIKISGDDGTVEFIEQNPTWFDKFSLNDYHVLTRLKSVLGASESSLSMITSSGRKTVTVDRANVLTAQNYDKLLNEGIDVDNVYKNVVSVAAVAPVVQSEYSGELGLSVDYDVITETVTASSSSAFIFCGKGWGHGVGMSQYGVLDLANAGMSGESIVATYFPGTTIKAY